LEIKLISNKIFGYITGYHMALLSPSHFSEDVDNLSVRDYEDLPDYPVDDDLEISLAYSVGYDSLPSFTENSLQSPVALMPSYSIDKKIDADQYVSVETFPHKKLSFLACCHRDRRAYYKNLYMLSIVFLLLIGVHHGLVGIQTTLNADRGLVTLAVENTMFVCSVMVAPAVIWLLGIRNTMLVACVLQVGYVTANYLRSYYTLVPGAVVGGLSLGIVWVTANLYLAITATNLAATINVKPTIAIGRFNGIFYTFVSLSLMIGNTISSVYFTAKVEVNCDRSQSGFNFTRNMSSFPVCSCDVDSVINDTTRYILVSIFTVGDVMAIVVLIVAVGKIPRLMNDGGELRARILRYLKHSLISIFRVHFNTKASLLIPVFMLEGLQAGYYLGTFTTVSSLSLYTYSKKYSYCITRIFGGHFNLVV